MEKLRGNMNGEIVPEPRSERPTMQVYHLGEGINPRVVPVEGEHHMGRYRQPYYRIVEGNLPEIAEQPEPEPRPIKRGVIFELPNRIIRRLKRG